MLRAFLGFIVAIVALSVIASGITAGGGLIWFELNHGAIPPEDSAAYLRSLFTSKEIMVCSYAVAAPVSGWVYVKLARPSSMLMALLYTVPVAILLGFPSEHSNEFSPALALMVFALATVGAFIGVPSAPNHSLKADGADAPPP